MSKENKSQIDLLLESVPDGIDKDMAAKFAIDVQNHINESIEQKEKELTESSAELVQQAITESSKTIQESIEIVNESVDELLEKTIETQLATITEQLVTNALYEKYHTAIVEIQKLLMPLVSVKSLKVNESTDSKIDELTAKYSKLEEMYNSLITENKKLKQEKFNIEKEAIIAESTINLNVAQKERVKSLTESLNFTNIDDFKKGLKLVMEALDDTKKEDDEDGQDDEKCSDDKDKSKYKAEKVRVNENLYSILD